MTWRDRNQASTQEDGYRIYRDTVVLDLDALPAPLATLAGHAQGVSDVAWDPDGAFLASASDDTTIRIWDAATVRGVVGEGKKSGARAAPCAPPRTTCL
jgi:WD40 repeat protein